MIENQNFQLFLIQQTKEKKKTSIHKEKEMTETGGVFDDLFNF